MKTFRKQNCYLYINGNYNDCHQRSTTCTNTKSKTKLPNIYIQKARHFSKSKTICVTFLYKKIRTLYVMQFFIESLKLAEGGGKFLNAKKMHFALHFNMERTMHLALRCYIQQIVWHYALHFNTKKQCTLRYVFISKIYCVVLIVNRRKLVDN